MNPLTNSATASATPFASVNYYLTVLTKYANFKGRARRSEYWYFVLVNVIVAFCLSFVVGLFTQTGAALINGLYTLAILVPYVAVSVRRMHDMDKEWWYALIPVYNFILAISEGTKGTNQYGADPKVDAFAETAQLVD